MAKVDILRGLVVAGDILGSVNRVNRSIDDINRELEMDSLRRDARRARAERDAARTRSRSVGIFSVPYIASDEDIELEETRAKLKSKIAKAKMKLIDCEGPFSKDFDPFKASQLRDKIRKLERTLDDLDD